MINVKIDVTKIDKKKLFEGQKGTYLDVVLIETPNNEYGNDYMAIQSVSKEEREKGIKGNILGNAKVFEPKQNQVPESDSANPGVNDMPF